MNMVRLLISAMPLAFSYCCLATVMVQVGAGAMLWRSGKLNKQKAVRYAAIAYGLDITELPAEASADGPAEENDEALTHEQLLAKRVNASEILADRRVAMKYEADTIRSLEKEIKSERDRREDVRKNFRDYLDKLEKEVVLASLGDVQRTLENLSPRQAKDIILRTLKDEGIDGDDVMDDVVTIFKEMPEGKLKKILGEFKTDQEQKTLHRIVMEIGGLASEGTP